MKSIASDQELLVAFTQGNNSAMDVIITRYHKKVLGYIRRTIKDSMLAEDLSQETFIKAINSIKEMGITMMVNLRHGYSVLRTILL